MYMNDEEISAINSNNNNQYFISRKVLEDRLEKGKAKNP